ncbi:putative outer membrane starch-binding protein [Chitinophaga niastensis]|uniref:Putative outer membrane starch-binding protein n=1 Tax=Chitinophaga niastensis TaxID=536980 RepID=A0A2P8HQ72_CHINA|nr:RagB/SusD family nutrient uptake outer membrane protein [Chitinophaga niastensis]PSL48357.1 putative outer membrane starch-binding protein [Chitinophaga niastensis]
MQSKYKTYFLKLSPKICNATFPYFTHLTSYYKLMMLIFLLNIFGCKKLLEINAPVTSTNAANVYNSDATAAAVLTGIYAKTSLSLRGDGLASLSLFPALSADELTLYGGSSNRQAEYIEYYLNSLNKSIAGGTDFSNSTYLTIFITNSAIEGLTQSTGLTPAVKQHLLGEAKFMRAFCYFYLVNLYGDVPLATGTDYTVNALLPRTIKAKVYQQIIVDLKEAQELLTDGYVAADALTSANDRLRPNKWASTALLARVYLYTEDWANAEIQATKIINNSSLYNLNTLNNVFLNTSTETIWQLQPVSNPGLISNTQDAKLFVLPSTGPTTEYQYPVYLSNNVVTSFEPGDQRKINWVDSVVVNKDSLTTITYYYPYKYKVIAPNAPVTEYTVVLRLAEQYLIRAEARAQQGNITGAASDLNVIRNRAGLLNTTESTKPGLLTTILHERQVELFTEWGHRWLDLKRSNIVDTVMSKVTPQKGGIWNSNWQWYPFILSDLLSDPNLVQNPGY